MGYFLDDVTLDEEAPSFGTDSFSMNPEPTVDSGTTFTLPDNSLTLVDSTGTNDLYSPPSTTTTTPTKPAEEEGGMFDGLTDRRVLGPVLQTVLGFGSQLLARQDQKDQLKNASEAEKQKALLALEMERLKYKYGLAGGGGGGKGGGGGGGSAARNAAYLNAYQNYIQGTNQVNQQAVQNLQNTGSAASGAFSNRVR